MRLEGVLERALDASERLTSVGSSRATLGQLIAKTGGDAAARRFGLLMNARHHVPQRAPQAVQLVDEIEDERNALVIQSETFQIMDQTRTGDVQLREAARLAVANRNQPASLDPGIQRLTVEMRLQKEFAPLHGYTSMAWRGL
jgi:hypothetical protein